MHNIGEPMSSPRLIPPLSHQVDVLVAAGVARLALIAHAHLVVGVKGEVVEPDVGMAAMRPGLPPQEGKEQLRGCDASVLPSVAPKCDGAETVRMQSQMKLHLGAQLDEEVSLLLSQQAALDCKVAAVMRYFVRVVGEPAAV